MAHLYHDREPPPDHSLPEPHRYSASALRPDQKEKPGNRGQIYSFYPGTLAPAMRSDPRTLASHLNGLWCAVCVQEGAGLVYDRSLSEIIHVITQHHRGVFLGRACTPLQVLACPHQQRM